MKKEEIVDYDITYPGMIKKIAELYGDYEVYESLANSAEERINNIVEQLIEFYPFSKIKEDVAVAYKEL